MEVFLLTDQPRQFQGFFVLLLPDEGTEDLNAFLSRGQATTHDHASGVRLNTSRNMFRQLRRLLKLSG